MVMVVSACLVQAVTREKRQEHVEDSVRVFYTRGRGSSGGERSVKRNPRRCGKFVTLRLLRISDVIYCCVIICEMAPLPPSPTQAQVSAKKHFGGKRIWREMRLAVTCRSALRSVPDDVLLIW